MEIITLPRLKISELQSLTESTLAICEPLTEVAKHTSYFAMASAGLQKLRVVLRMLLQLCRSPKLFCDAFCNTAKPPNSFAMVFASLQKGETCLFRGYQT